MQKKKELRVEARHRVAELAHTHVAVQRLKLRARQRGREEAPGLHGAARFGGVGGRWPRPRPTREAAARAPRQGVDGGVVEESHEQKKEAAGVTEAAGRSQPRQM